MTRVSSNFVFIILRSKPHEQGCSFAQVIGIIVLRFQRPRSPLAGFQPLVPLRGRARRAHRPRRRATSRRLNKGGFNR